MTTEENTGDYGAFTYVSFVDAYTPYTFNLSLRDSGP